MPECRPAAPIFQARRSRNLTDLAWTGKARNSLTDSPTRELQWASWGAATEDEIKFVGTDQQIKQFQTQLVMEDRR